MRKTQHIIIHLFLLGMLLTVFQYLPILEEEAPSHRTELNKKAKGTDTSGDNDGEDDDASDTDTDAQSDLFFAYIHHYNFSADSQDKFYLSVPLYNSLTAKVNTPPPKA